MMFSDNINFSTSLAAQLSTADAAACLHLDIYIFDADAGSGHRQSTDNLDLSCAGLGRRSSNRAPEYIHYV